MSEVEMVPGKWYRLVGKQGELKAETSDREEALGFMEEGDILYRMWVPDPSYYVWRPEETP